MELISLKFYALKRKLDFSETGAFSFYSKLLKNTEDGKALCKSSDSNTNMKNTVRSLAIISHDHRVFPQVLSENCIHQKLIKMT